MAGRCVLRHRNGLCFPTQSRAYVRRIATRRLLQRDGRSNELVAGLIRETREPAPVGAKTNDKPRSNRRVRSTRLSPKLRCSSSKSQPCSNAVSPSTVRMDRSSTSASVSSMSQTVARTVSWPMRCARPELLSLPVPNGSEALLQANMDLLAAQLRVERPDFNAKWGVTACTSRRSAKCAWPSSCCSGRSASFSASPAQAPRFLSGCFRMSPLFWSDAHHRSRPSQSNSFARSETATDRTRRSGVEAARSLESRESAAWASSPWEIPGDCCKFEACSKVAGV